MTKCAYFHVPDLLDSDDKHESCDADAEFTCCDFGGPVCERHKCRCSKPLTTPGPMTGKVYLVVRGDLPLGQQAVQAAHALQEFNIHYPVEAKVWHKNSNTLAILEVPTEVDLGVILEQARLRRIPAAAFREPDRGNELTAIALGPQGKRLTRKLPLALRWSSSPSLSSPCSSPSSASSS